ncbi:MULTISPECIES: CGNR zinc finger domain-containing protein [Streptomyces]|uniref:CGNR zinc finger domain-containing protein n=1 Tax=Streptomyces xanthii TaxID=2768069 RepID=A0A7H1B6P2_9ACTN|nr:CGNR zinc finger domain-containing protein [Streptomyces xanthii]QNS04397.1 CGNR zinc finger domain-containing protein [Streptomyces xanthii]
MQRPLTGEPLALDLVNTAWVDQGQPFDLFEEPGALDGWLAEHGLTPRTSQALEPLLLARTALRAALAGDSGPLNDVLRHGARRPLLDEDGRPAERLVLDSPEWEPAWRAAADYVRLLGERPERVRKCANEVCVLWFHDVSKNGRRRWCSMEGCGNRAKTTRYQARHRVGE